MEALESRVSHWELLWAGKKSEFYTQYVWKKFTENKRRAIEKLK